MFIYNAIAISYYTHTHTHSHTLSISIVWKEKKTFSFFDKEKKQWNCINKDIDLLNDNIKITM